MVTKETGFPSCSIIIIINNLSAAQQPFSKLAWFKKIPQQNPQ